MSNSPEGEVIKKPEKLTYEEIISDLYSVPINKSDVLFERVNEPKSNSQDDELYKRIEKFILFKSNLEQEVEYEDQKNTITGNFEKEFDEIEEKLNKLQNFIDISEKFLSISNKQTWMLDFYYFFISCKFFPRLTFLVNLKKSNMTTSVVRVKEVCRKIIAVGRNYA